MTKGMQHVLAGLAIATPLALGVAMASSAPGHQVFSFEDPAIVEASALVVDDGLFLTTNDSGDTGRVFAVAHTGRTLGVTHWSDDPTDTEALAPAGHGYVWVGDIGDNSGRRSSVEIARIPIERGDRTVRPATYRLRYPDGATDAEALLRDPSTGRLYIASKNVFGGVLYAVPEHLDASGTNRLRRSGGSCRWPPTGRSSQTASTWSCATTPPRWSTPGRRCSRSGPSTCRMSARVRGSRSRTTAGSTSRPRARTRRCSG